MKKFLLLIAAVAAFATSASAQNYTSVVPAANTVLPEAYTNYAEMKFTFTFDQAISTTSLGQVKLTDAAGAAYDPDDAWVGTKSNGGKTVAVWGADYDGFVCTFKVTEQPYYFSVPAGAFKIATGATNEAFTITYYGKSIPEPTAITDVNKGNASVVGRYNLKGQSVDANAQGVQIVKMSDGSTVKVIVR
ncbi:MAG: hypothetical protein Q4B68_02280 [Bacteroidales bacterium]|nr:hypothetical protein [Bacteroidales bacterium]